MSFGALTNEVPLGLTANAWSVEALQALSRCASISECRPEAEVKVL